MTCVFLGSTLTSMPSLVPPAELAEGTLDILGSPSPAELSARISSTVARSWLRHSTSARSDVGVVSEGQNLF
ncbi:hypothetical protein GCM10010507_20090 [Streptomyces cinnamoneus]|uniref:Uncharacterized protein n=1 Tax=Streptomyces cinnamoneus TaxID=53446 RepID=A0A918WF05_STRCJ|nr:hypothetical protein GCM10010507_20090 [Streptomyces cinnamoneus]